MSKRIAFLLPSLKGGGVQRQIINLARELLQRGYKVDTLILDSSEPAYSDLPDWRLVNLGSRRAIASLFVLTRFLRKERPNFLISAQTHVNTLAVLARRLAGTPPRLIVTERNHLSASAHNAARFADRLRPMLVRYFYPHADRIVALSASMADDMAVTAHLPRQNIHVIHNSVAVDDVQRLAEESPVHPWFAKGEPPVILTVGRLTPQKGYPDLLDAFSKLRARRSARLLILGEGEQRSALEAQVQRLGLTRDVDMPGFAANPFSYMSRASLFALASHWEGFVNVITEALACGLPVVSTDHPGGAAEVLANGKFGRLTPVGDVDALTAAMEATLDALPSRESLIARARDFSVSRMADAYLQLLGEM